MKKIHLFTLIFATFFIAACQTEINKDDKDSSAILSEQSVSSSIEEPVTLDFSDDLNYKENSSFNHTETVNMQKVGEENFGYLYVPSDWRENSSEEDKNAAENSIRSYASPDSSMIVRIGYFKTEKKVNLRQDIRGTISNLAYDYTVKNIETGTTTLNDEESDIFYLTTEEFSYGKYVFSDEQGNYRYINVEFHPGDQRTYDSMQSDLDYIAHTFSL